MEKADLQHLMDNCFSMAKTAVSKDSNSAMMNGEQYIAAGRMAASLMEIALANDAIKRIVLRPSRQ